MRREEGRFKGQERELTATNQETHETDHNVDVKMSFTAPKFAQRFDAELERLNAVIEVPHGLDKKRRVHTASPQMGCPSKWQESNVVKVVGFANSEGLCGTEQYDSEEGR